MISYVCNDSHDGGYYICGKHGELIHVEGWSTALDGCETHHEVFEGQFGFQIMPWSEGYCLERFLRCRLDKR